MPLVTLEIGVSGSCSQKNPSLYRCTYVYIISCSESAQRGTSGTNWRPTTLPATGRPRNFLLGRAKTSLRPNLGLTVNSHVLLQQHLFPLLLRTIVLSEKSTNEHATQKQRLQGQGQMEAFKSTVRNRILGSGGRTRTGCGELYPMV
jgi:hypothetical protein